MEKMISKGELLRLVRWMEETQSQSCKVKTTADLIGTKITFTPQNMTEPVIKTYLKDDL